MLYEVLRHTGTESPPLRSGRRLTQRFIARADRLNALSIWPASWSGQRPARLLLTLRDLASDGVLREARVEAAKLVPGSWHRIPFQQVQDSKGKTYAFSLEIEGEAADLTLWTNDRMAEGCRENGAALDCGALCHRTHYLRRIHADLDRVLSTYARHCPETTIVNSEMLHELIRSSLLEERDFLHLLHLLDALDHTRGVRRVASTGLGSGRRAAFLAARFPDMTVETAAPMSRDFLYEPPNLVFTIAEDASVENPECDFAFAIESPAQAASRESISRLAARVRPGGWIYLAQARENAAGALDLTALTESFAGGGLEIVLARPLLDARLTRALNGLLEVLSVDPGERFLSELIRICLLDLNPIGAGALPQGVKCLGRRPAGGGV